MGRVDAVGTAGLAADSTCAAAYCDAGSSVCIGTAGSARVDTACRAVRVGTAGRTRSRGRGTGVRADTTSVDSSSAVIRPASTGSDASSAVGVHARVGKRPAERCGTVLAAIQGMMAVQE